MGDTQKKDIVRNDGLQEKNAYSIIDYLKEHHSLMIAIVSAIVAIFSFVINLVNYLNVSTYFKFWDIEISQVTFNFSNQVYTVITAFSFQVIVLFATWFVLNTYDSYRKRQQTFMHIKWKRRKISKDIKESCEELALAKTRILTLKKRLDNKEELNELERKTEKIKEIIENSKQKVKEIEKVMRKHKVQDICLLLMSNVIVFLTIFVACNILFATLIYYDNALQYSLLFSAVYVGSNVLVFGGINYFYIRREMEKRVDCDREEIVYTDLPIEKVIWGEWKLVVSNEVIKSIIIQLVIITIVFMFSFSYAGYSKAKEQKEFQYVTSAQETYVVIYNNGVDLVMKKASIEADNITIDLSVQKTISIEDVVLCKKRFSTVKVIRT